MTNMLKERLKDWNLILASASPRRHQFFKIMELDFEVRLHPIREVYPKDFTETEITDYLAQLKAEPFLPSLEPKDILVTSDTIVWHRNEAIGKPTDEKDAFQMIQQLSGDRHKVISSICITTSSRQTIKNAVTEVTFRKLSDEEIRYYVQNFKPLDKAGAYGIQEWIGAVGISGIKGSYNNVVGLPTHLLYQTLINMVNSF